MSLSPETLLPCPFCGETDEIYQALGGMGGGKPYAIDCLGCGIDFTPREGSDVIAAWNRRSALPVGGGGRGSARDGSDAHIEVRPERPHSAGLDIPLPCDVKVAHMTFRKGVSLRTFVNAATRWHAAAAWAQKPDPEKLAEFKAWLECRSAREGDLEVGAGWSVLDLPAESPPLGSEPPCDEGNQATDAINLPPPTVGVDELARDLWDALKRQCCATKPTDKHWDEVSTLVTVRKPDVDAAAQAILHRLQGGEG